MNVQDPTSIEHLQTVNDALYGFYREACHRLQLLEKDHHWDQTLNDAIISSKANQIRTWFSIIASTCFPSKPTDLWIKYNDEICDDILDQMPSRIGNLYLQFTEQILRGTNIN